MKTKKILALIMMLAVLISLLPQMVMAALMVTIDLSSVSSGGIGYTCEAITVNTMTEYVVTITDPGDYELTGTSTQVSKINPTAHSVHVVVSAPTANITLNNANVSIVNFSPLAINPGSVVNLTLAAGTENTLTLGSSEVSLAAVSVPEGASIVIGGTGKLNAQGGASGNGAGIGSGFNQFVTGYYEGISAGRITINSGIVNAVGGVSSPGIGSYEGFGGYITINGGEVTATSPSVPFVTSAGIGGGNGANITIAGGTVIAQSGNATADAIGTGTSYITPATLNFVGGSIKALSPIRIKSTPKNDNTDVYLTTVTVEDNDGSPLSNTEVSCKIGQSTFSTKTDSSGKLYLWLPAGDTSIVVSSGGTVCQAKGTVLTDDSTVLTTSEFKLLEVNGKMYESWSDAVAAVQEGQTITLLKDVILTPSDTMPTVACTISGGTSRYKLTLDGQTLKADTALKDLNLGFAGNGQFIFNCSGHILDITGTVEAKNDVSIVNGSQLNINGTVKLGEYGGVSGFTNMSLSAQASLSAFSLDTINASINGTVTCKYFKLGNSSGSSGVLSGTGRLIFTMDGGEGSNLTFKNASIDSNAKITLEASGYTPHEGQSLVENTTPKGSKTAIPLSNIDRLVLGSSYSGFKLEGKDYTEWYGYELKTVPVDNANGGTPSGNGGGGGNNNPVTSPVTPPTTTTDNSSGVTTTVTEAKTDSTGKASAAVTESQITDAVKKSVETASKQGEKIEPKVEIKVQAPAGAKSVETSLPKKALNTVAESKAAALTISTPVAAITFDDKALDTISGQASGDVKITAARTDVSTLSEETREAVGDRPVFNFSVTSGDKTISQFGGSVMVAVPYTPKPGEDPNAIVIYYINAQGKPEIVSNCKYDSATGTISFETNHFSQYAVGYNKVNFSDVSEDAWYSKSISFIAARGITSGSGNGQFNPGEKLTRGQFIVMVMKAYGINPDQNPADNFADAGNTYYTNYLAAAKRLGITGGVGNNMFVPDNEISRQEMFVLLYNALKATGNIPKVTGTKTLVDFVDGGKVASWAKDAMTFFVQAGKLSGTEGRLSPTSTTSRAEMAQVLYNLLSE